MRTKLLTTFVLAALLLTGSSFAAEKFTIDPVHSFVGFSIKHLVISTAKGEFTTFEGEVMLDEEKMENSSVMVTIDASSIDTNNPDRDKHLRSADFFEVEKFPTITFKSNKIEKTSDGLLMHGDITMHGVTKEITIPFDFLGKTTTPYGQTLVAFEGETELNRKDFGIEWNKVLDTGGLTVGNEVQIELHIEAIKK